MEYGLVALWLFTYLVLLYLGMPLAHALLPDLDDFGAGVALQLALALVWLVVFFLGRLSITIALWIGLLALGSLAATLWYRGYDIDHAAYVRVALVFTTAFCFLIAIRAVDPAATPNAGEKFLDMGLLQSSLRGTTVPPEDAWFAGESVRYYYGGHLLASLLARITGTEGRFAYNLALAGYYAMLVTAAYGLARSIAAHRGFSAHRAGLAGAFFVGIASNLQTTFRFGGAILDRGASELGLLGAPLGLLATGWNWVAALLLPLPRDRGLANSISEFSYWSASRVIDNAITEFPLFAWLHGDLHAHMMSTPFLLVVATILLQLFVSGSARSRRRTLATLFGVLPGLGAVVAVVNTWSFPAVGGLIVLTLALGPTHPLALLRGATDRTSGSWLAREGKRLGVAVVVGVIVLALAWALSSPYWLFESSTANTYPGAFPGRSTFAELLLTHGAFLLLYGLYLYRHGHYRGFEAGVVVCAALVYLGLRSVFGMTVLGLFTMFVLLYGIVLYRNGDDEGLRAVAVAAGVIVLVDVTTVLTVPAVGLFVPIILGGWILLRRSGPVSVAGRTVIPWRTDEDDESPPQPGFETVLLVAVAGLIVLVEFFYVVEPGSGGRFNTVFKVYMQVWVLAGVAAGVILVRLLEERHPALGLSGHLGRRAFTGLGVVLMAAVSLYGILALTVHFGLTGDIAGSAPVDALAVIPAWSALAGFLLALVIVWSLATIGLDRLAEHSAVIGESQRVGLTLVIGLLVVGAGLYGSLGIAAAYTPDEPVDTFSTDTERIADPTLDALAFVERDHNVEAAAIYWLDSEVEGQPNMLSDPGPQYRWYNGPASLTGVPTVLGKLPERAYRGPEVYDQRRKDVRTMFTGEPDEQRQLLAKYDVELIYVGPNERSEYRPITVDRLEAVTVEKQWPVVTIYSVDQQALGD